MREQSTDYLAPNRKRPAMLSYEQAQSMRRPRRCNVPWHRQGGAICCELCVNQYFAGVPLTVHCVASEDPPLFRPLQPKD